MLAAAQLFVQGLQLLALAGDDLAARVLAAHILHHHQHGMAASGIRTAGAQLYALVHLHAQLVCAAVAVFLSQTLGRSRKVLGVAAPDLGRQQRLQRLALGGGGLYVKPLVPALVGQLQSALFIPQSAAQPGLTEQFGQ